MTDANNSKAPVDQTAEAAPEAAPAAPAAEQADGAKKSNVTRRQVLAMAGCGVAGLVVGGVLASWGVTQQAIASGRIDVRKIGRASCRERVY